MEGLARSGKARSGRGSEAASTTKIGPHGLCCIKNVEDRLYSVQGLLYRVPESVNGAVITPIDLLDLNSEP